MTKEKLEDFLPHPGVRQGYVGNRREGQTLVFSAIDLVRMSKCCGKVSAKGILWRILKEHAALSSQEKLPSGIFSVKLSPEEDEIIAVDAEMACELLLLIPGSAHAQLLRRKAVKSLLEIEDSAVVLCVESVMMHSSPSPEAYSRFEGLRVRGLTFSTLRRLLTAAAIFYMQLYPLCLKPDSSIVLLRGS